MELALVALTSSALAMALVPVVYPAVAWALARATPPGPLPGDHPPGPPSGVSAVVSFVAETGELAATANAFLASDPGLPKELVLVADGPTPEARETAEELAAGDPRIVLAGGPDPRGKARRQAEGAARATHPVLLLLDAGTEPTPGSVLALAAPLGDPAVAYTTGRLVYRAARHPEPDQARAGSAEEDAYWDLESTLKGWEDAWIGPLGAAGGFFACRRADYVPTPPGGLVDLVTPCLVERATGGRARYVAAAEAIEPGRGGRADWREARVRIQARALASMPLLAGWLAGVSPARSLQFLAHKLLRWHAATSLGLAALAGSSLALLGSFRPGLPPGPGTPLSAATGVGLAAFCSISWLASRVPVLSDGPFRLLGVVGYAGEAQLRGLIRALAGRAPECWDP